MLLAIPTIILCSIRQLKFVAPLTLIANILQIGSLFLIVYDLLTSPLSHSHPVPLFGQLFSLPFCLSIIFFALGGISVVLPIQNQMAEPPVEPMQPLPSQARLKQRSVLAVKWNDLLCRPKRENVTNL